MSSGLRAMCLTSLLLHLLGLTALSVVGGSLWSVSSPSNVIPTALLVEPPPAVVSEPVPPPEPEPLPLPPPPAPLPEPVAPPRLEKVIPPKLVEKPLPERAAPRVKPPPPVSRVRRQEPLPSRPPGAPRAAEARAPTPPGPPLPLLAEARAPAPGNVLGASAERPPDAAPPPPAEGGEADAGKLFDRGDVGVVPGGGAGGGSGGPGRAGPGTGGAEASGGTRVAGLQPGGGGDVLARPLGGYQVKPRYPESARRQGIEGVTVLKVRVTERGQVEEVQVERSAGHPALDQSAVEGVRRWRFGPARRGSVPVAVWVLIPVKFELR